MKPIRIERDVAAPPDRVWSTLTDLDRSPQVLSGVDRIERLDDGAGFAVGTRWRETRTMFGKEATEVMWVTAMEPGRSYVVEAESRGVHYRSELGVSSEGDEASRLWMTFDAEPRTLGGRIMGATIGLLFRGATRKMLARDLDDIAVVAERR
jgi:carbon monoxide dehydrogenase subunit G